MGSARTMPATSDVIVERSCFSIYYSILAKVEEARMMRVRMSKDMRVKNHWVVMAAGRLLRVRHGGHWGAGVGCGCERLE